MGNKGTIKTEDGYNINYLKMLTTQEVKNLNHKYHIIRNQKLVDHNITRICSSKNMLLPNQLMDLENHRIKSQFGNL